MLKLVIAGIALLLVIIVIRRAIQKPPTAPPREQLVAYGIHFCEDHVRETFSKAEFKREFEATTDHDQEQYLSANTLGKVWVAVTYSAHDNLIRTDCHVGLIHVPGYFHDTDTYMMLHVESTTER